MISCEEMEMVRRQPQAGKKNPTNDNYHSNSTYQGCGATGRNVAKIRTGKSTIAKFSVSLSTKAADTSTVTSEQKKKQRKN